MGTPQFAVPSLRAVLGSHDVAAVYTRPDSASGRGRALLPSPVKVEAMSRGLEVRTPTTLRDAEVTSELRALAPHVIVVAAYGVLLPKSVLEIPRLGCINVHASLLPRWRGAAPIQRAILAGDEVTGVSIMRMEEGLDTGPFCAAGDIKVENKGAEQITSELAELGAHLLVGAFKHIEAGTCEWIEQDESLASYARKISKDDVAVSPDLSQVEFVRRVRASSAAAPARVTILGRGITILKATAEAPAEISQGGIVFDGHRMMLGVCDGVVALARVKPDGKQAMDAAAWARGLRLESDSSWEAGR